LRGLRASKAGICKAIVSLFERGVQSTIRIRTASLPPVFFHLARIVVALLGILMDEAAIDWSEVIFEGRRL
jgi:hypothetical protein